MPVNAELLARLLTPIPGDEPSGSDLRYDARYAAIKEARREDPDLPTGELDGPRKLAEWPQVVSLSVALLETETKDLQLAAWLTEAMLRKDGIPGLLTGVDLLEGYLQQLWDSFYPVMEDEEDVELRSGPLEWIGGRLDLPVRQSPIAQDGTTVLDYIVSRGIPTEAEADSNKDKREQRAEALEAGKRSPEEVDSAIEASPKSYYKVLLADIDATVASLAKLEAISDERFGNDAPGFTSLRKALEEVTQVARSILARKLELDPDPIEEEGEEELVADVTGDGTISIEPTSARDAAGRIAAAAKYLRAEDPMNPAPYLLLRGFRWGELRATPGDLNPKLLEAPPTPVRSRLKGLLIDGRWQELLEQGESLMSNAQGRGWLDLQRYTLTACRNLGDGYDAVAAVVRSELRALLIAIPQLPHMTLMDDTPTANGETREWLEEEGITPDAADPEAATSGAAPPADAPVDDDAPDTPADDGTEALEDALAEDDATSQSGGLAKAPVRRASARAGSTGRDPFSVARTELGLGRPNRAIEIMVAQHAKERSPRGRFVRQTQVAFLMVEAGLESVARPILERLIQIIEERNLEEWESGPLVAQPMSLLCRVYDKLEVREDDREELYLRVCRLDPMQALGLSGS